MTTKPRGGGLIGRTTYKIFFGGFPKPDTISRKDGATVRKTIEDDIRRNRSLRKLLKQFDEYDQKKMG